MKQLSLATTRFDLATMLRRKREFHDETKLLIPRSVLFSLIALHSPEGKTGRPTFAKQMMFRIHLLRQFFGKSDPPMQEPLYEIPLYQESAHPDQTPVQRQAADQ